MDTVYFGGGTPSFYGEKRLREVLKTVAKRFDLAKDAEITVECNPDSVDKKVFQALRRAGVNRISLGVQSAHDRELNCLGTAPIPPSRPSGRWPQPERPRSKTSAWI